MPNIPKTTGTARASRLLNASTPAVDFYSDIEAQTLGTTLDAGQWTIEGRRSRAFVLLAGGGDIAIDSDAKGLAAPALIWLPSGTPARLTLRAGSNGAWLAAADVVLDQIALPGNISDDLRRLFGRRQLGVPINLAIGRQLAAAFAGIESELRDRGPGAEEVIRHQLALIAITLWRHSGIAAREIQPMPRVIVANFLQLIDARMRNQWTVAEYADYLGITTDRLNSAVHRALGISPLAAIHQRQLLEARQMLESSGMQIAEIANALGFEDPAYFSRFFKRLTGTSPRQHRAAFAIAQLRAIESFAAWP